VALAVIMALTGHQSERTLRDYLRGVDRSPLAKVAQETLAAEVAPTLGRAGRGNTRKFTGLTGRAAAKARREAAGTLPPAAAKHLPNAEPPEPGGQKIPQDQWRPQRDSNPCYQRVGKPVSRTVG
jgi:hypothetical protein